MITIAAYLFTGATSLVVLFYVALIFGAPWGAASMGGKFPGKFPPPMRVVSVVNICLLTFLNVIVLSRANLFFTELYDFSTVGIWFVVAFYLLGTILNTITPSKIERIWAPVALTHMISSLLIALS